MQSHQIINELEQGKKQGKEFIKWWRGGGGSIDYELVDRYVEMIDTKHEIGDFELLDKDEMWEILKRWNPSGLHRLHSSKGEQIEWQHKGKDGQKHSYTCPYTARAIMSIFDVETQGDTT